MPGPSSCTSMTTAPCSSWVRTRTEPRGRGQPGVPDQLDQRLLQLPGRDQHPRGALRRGRSDRGGRLAELGPEGPADAVVRVHRLGAGDVLSRELAQPLDDGADALRAVLHVLEQLAEAGGQVADLHLGERAHRRGGVALSAEPRRPLDGVGARTRAPRRRSRSVERFPRTAASGVWISCAAPWASCPSEARRSFSRSRASSARWAVTSR